MNEERRLGILISIGVIFIGIYAMYKFYQSNIDYFQNAKHSRVIERLRPDIDTHIKSLEDTVSENRKLAATALGNILQQNLPERLKEKLKSTNLDELREAVKKTDGLIPDVIPSLQTTLNDKNAEVRRAAAMALGKVSPTFLVLIFNRNQRGDVRQSIMEVLVELGQESISSLTQALKELCANSSWANSADHDLQNQFIHSYAVNDISTTLVKVGSQSISLRDNVLHAIRPGIRSENPGLVLVSTWVAIKLDPMALSCVHPLIKFHVNTENLFDVVDSRLLLNASNDLNNFYNIQ
jgi:hypothetical protein